MQIVIDTNALETDRYAARPAAAAAWAGAAAGDFQIHVPEVVVLELVKHFPDELHGTVEAVNDHLEKRYRELNTFGLRGPEQMVVDIDGLVADYERRLRDRATEPGCRVAPTPNLDEAAEWAVARRPPFDTNGHGLPDAAIWLTALELAAEDDVILVTNNKSDFGTSAGLLVELEEDLRRRRLPVARVRIVPNLIALQQQVVSPAATAVARAERLLAGDAALTSLLEATADALRWTTVDSRTLDLMLDLDEDPRISELELDRPRLDDVRELGERQLIATLTALGDAALELSVFRADYFEAEAEGVALDSFDPDAHYSRGELVVAVEVTVDVVIDLPSGVSQAELISFRRLTDDEAVRRLLMDRPGSDLRELAKHEIVLSQVSGYIPPERLRSEIQSATVESWRVQDIELGEILDADEHGRVVSLNVAVEADVTWLASAPDPADLAEFAGFAENVDGGGGFMQSMETDAPLMLDLNARLQTGEWHDLEVVSLRLDERARADRIREH